MSAVPPFDRDLLVRYDRPGPRYTSYPTAPQFTQAFDEKRFRDCARKSNAEPIPRSISLYVHIPYCFSPCFYCGCNRIITRDPAQGERYLERLRREIEQVAPLFDRDRDVIQLHLGGGTPNFLRPTQLGELLESLDRHFHFSSRPDRDFSIELDPRWVHNFDDIAELARLGFNRVSLGVQDFDPDVQRAVNRIQSVAETLAVIDACRAVGMRSVNLDLIYGLPKQHPEAFARTLDTVIAARPERLAIYGMHTWRRCSRLSGRLSRVLRRFQADAPFASTGARSRSSIPRSSGSWRKISCAAAPKNRAVNDSDGAPRKAPWRNIAPCGPGST
jgi:oxygen-independent coproporphyrinogen III oxidase